MTITADQEALDRAARLLTSAQAEISQARKHTPRSTADIIRFDPVDLASHAETTVGALDAANESVQQAQALLIGMGAARPGLSVAKDALRLDQLDTPATRNLLACLRDAVRAAQLVDEERGWVDGSGEGIGWAETLGALELGLRREVIGAEGSGLE